MKLSLFRLTAFEFPQTAGTFRGVGEVGSTACAYDSTPNKYEVAPTTALLYPGDRAVKSDAERWSLETTTLTIYD
jgi:hypothetical protein